MSLITCTKEQTPIIVWTTCCLIHVRHYLPYSSFNLIQLYSMDNKIKMRLKRFRFGWDGGRQGQHILIVTQNKIRLSKLQCMNGNEWDHV